LTPVIFEFEYDHLGSKLFRKVGKLVPHQLPHIPEFISIFEASSV